MCVRVCVVAVCLVSDSPGLILASLNCGYLSICLVILVVTLWLDRDFLKYLETISLPVPWTLCVETCLQVLTVYIFALAFISYRASSSPTNERLESFLGMHTCMWSFWSIEICWNFSETNMDISFPRFFLKASWTAFCLLLLLSLTWAAVVLNSHHIKQLLLIHFNKHPEDEAFPTEWALHQVK